MTIARHLAELIGGTPLLALSRLGAGLPGELVAKLDLYNPLGSDADRVARALLDHAAQSGTLPEGGTIVEATSGNLAFSLAALAVPRGYRLTLVMPDSVPAWRVELLRALGAEVLLTAHALGMRGAAERADRAAQALDAYRPNQFANPVAVGAMAQVADEIWDACDGQVDAFVAPLVTGGTISGVGQRLKELSGGRVRVVAVEPARSPVLSGGQPASHRLLGMGPPFVPPNFDPTLPDEIIAVADGRAYETLLRLYRTEGVPSGPAGAAAVAAALEIATRSEMAGKRIVAHLPDGMERYSGLGFWDSFAARVSVPLELLAGDP